MMIQFRTSSVSPYQLVRLYMVGSALVIVAWLMTALLFWEPHHLTWTIAIFAVGLAIPMALTPLAVLILVGFFEAANRVDEQLQEIATLKQQVLGLKLEIAEMRERATADALHITELLQQLSDARETIDERERPT